LSEKNTLIVQKRAKWKLLPFNKKLFASWKLLLFLLCIFFKTKDVNAQVLFSNPKHSWPIEVKLPCWHFGIHTWVKGCRLSTRSIKGLPSPSYAVRKREPGSSNGIEKIIIFWS